VEYAKRGVAMVAVNFGDRQETIAVYLAKEKLALVAARQEKGEVSDAFGVRTYPTTYVIAPDGKVAWRMVGFDEASLRSALDKVAPAK
jgi:thioredoxin-like negative regulator of GroEL